MRMRCDASRSMALRAVAALSFETRARKSVFAEHVQRARSSG
jgi:hypothetical protein